MQLQIIDAGTFLCDGGGIFGTVPKILWSRYIQADDRNLIRIAMNCMLVSTANRHVLIDSGAGDKLGSKFALNNGIEGGQQRLLQSLKDAGLEPEDITDVLHTHLHWDHCGGGTRYNEKNELVCTFPNARYYCSKAQWENANNPNPREGDAYFKEDLEPVEKEGRLQLIENDMELIPGIELRLFDGHTPGMIVPLIDTGSKKIAYVNDLTPLTANVRTKWVAAYDLLPMKTMEEKERFLQEAEKNEYILFFEHETKHECATIKWDEKKGPMVDQTGSLTSFY